jgi:hypothetical protein
MKKAPRRAAAPASPDMRSEYRLDYRKARPNRFAGRVPADTVAVVLDPDVMSVFDSPESVNAFLRSAIRAMPGGRKKSRRVG